MLIPAPAAAAALLAASIRACKQEPAPPRQAYLLLADRPALAVSRGPMRL